MRDTAAGLAALGRGPDSMLVHMSPREVAGLQHLAMAHGGSLTTNPQTGLPEAGFLSSILPMVAGAALAATGVGAPMAALMVGGVGALATGSLGKGLMMGLGAYGGANIGGALSAAGAAEAAAPTLATEAATTTNAAANAALSPELQGLAQSNMYTDPLSGVSQRLPPPAPTFENMGKGISNVFSGGPAGDQARSAFMGSIDGGKGLLKSGMMAAAPMLQEAMQPEPLELAPKQPYQYYKTSFSQERNPRFGQPGEPYFIQRYAPGSFTTNPVNAAGGGLMAFADGGYVPESGKFRIPAPGAEGDESRTPRTSFEFGGYAPEKDDPLKNMSELQLKMIAARSKDPELKGRAISELYVRQAAATPAQGFMSAEDFAKGAARGGLMALADGGAVPAPIPTTSPLLQQVQTPPPDALNNYLAGLGQSLMGGQQPQMAPATYTPVEPAAPAPAPTAGGGAFGRAFSRLFSPPQPAPSTHQYTFNPATQTYGMNPNYVDPASLDTGLSDQPEQYSRYSGDGDAAGGPIKAKYAAGGLGSLPEYAAGGKLLDGPGDGVSDSIPAVIKGPKPQRAALADGEFVIPARIVSELGNGSTKAGAKRLYAMMDRVQNARRKTTGKDKVAVNTRPDSLLPA